MQTDGPGDFPLDDIDLSGDKFLSGAVREQLDVFFETEVVATVLKRYGVNPQLAIRWGRERYGDPRMMCNCLPEIVPQFPQRITAVRLKFDTKRITTLSYDWLERSVVGEAVHLHDAHQDHYWIVTDLTIMPGPVVVGKRSFPLETPFTGYVSANKDQECYLLCNLKHFLASPFCDPR